MLGLLPQGETLETLMHKPLVCNICLAQCGLEVVGTDACWICPGAHGVRQVIPLAKVNGAYDLAKLGGTE